MRSLGIKLFFLVFLSTWFVMNAQFKPNKFYAGGDLLLRVFDDIRFGGEIGALSEKYIYSAEFLQSGTDEWDAIGPNPDEKFNQLNVLFGKYHDTKNKKFRFQYQAGLGYFWGYEEIDLEYNNSSDTYTHVTEDISTIGVPLKVGGKFIPFKFMSVGIDFHVNLNAKEIVFNPMISLNLGQLR